MTDPKFPEMDVPVNGELSLRGRIALYLLHGALSGPQAKVFTSKSCDEVAKAFYRLADAMIAADQAEEEDDDEA